MDKKVNDKSEFRCNICNKLYSSKSSLCNHNKKFHDNINNNNQLVSHMHNQALVPSSYYNNTIININNNINNDKLKSKKFIRDLIEAVPLEISFDKTPNNNIHDHIITNNINNKKKDISYIPKPMKKKVVTNKRMSVL